MQELKFSTSQTERLDEFLRRELPRAVVSIQVLRACSTTGISNSKIRRLILAGAVQVNGRPVLRPAFELRRHSIITVRFEAERFFYEKQPDDLAFKMSDAAVLYEDENLIFVD